MNMEHAQVLQGDQEKGNEVADSNAALKLIDVIYGTAEP